MDHPVILFDGVCNLCNGFVRFVIRNDKANRFRFSALQSEAAKKLLTPFHFNMQELNTIVLFEKGKIYLRSRAVLRIATQLDGAWKLAAIFYVLPSFISDSVYNLISKFRYKLFGKRETCMVPTSEMKMRFLD